MLRDRVQVREAEAKYNQHEKTLFSVILSIQKESSSARTEISDAEIARIPELEVKRAGFVLF